MIAARKSRRASTMSGAGAASSATPPVVAALERPEEQSSAATGKKKNILASYCSEKVTWSIHQQCGAPQPTVRKIEFDHAASTVVKGDEADGFGEMEEDEPAEIARISAEAHEAGLQEELLFMSDVVKSKLHQAKEVFDAQTIAALDGHTFMKDAADDDEEGADAVRSDEGFINTEMQDDLRHEERQRVQQRNELMLRSLHGGLQLLREHEDDSVGSSYVSTAQQKSSQAAFGLIFADPQAADAFARAKHGPVRRMPGSESAPLYVCSASESAMPSRSLAAEKKRDVAEGDKKKAAFGSRASAFFERTGCHGCFQVCLSLH